MDILHALFVSNLTLNIISFPIIAPVFASLQKYLFKDPQNFDFSCAFYALRISTGLK